MFIKTKVWEIGKTANGLAAFLKNPDSSSYIPVYLSGEEAHEILTAINGTENAIPGIYEVFLSLFLTLKIRIESIEILKAKSPGYYRSIIHFKTDNNRLALESKTPDAIILGIRADIPIFIEDSIFEEDSITITGNDTPFASQLSRLYKELEIMVEKENYEEP